MPLLLHACNKEISENENENENENVAELGVMLYYVVELHRVHLRFGLIIPPNAFGMQYVVRYCQQQMVILHNKISKKKKREV